MLASCLLTEWTSCFMTAFFSVFYIMFFVTLIFQYYLQLFSNSTYWMFGWSFSNTSPFSQSHTHWSRFNVRIIFVICNATCSTFLLSVPSSTMWKVSPLTSLQSGKSMHDTCVKPDFALNLVPNLLWTDRLSENNAIKVMGLSARFPVSRSSWTKRVQLSMTIADTWLTLHLSKYHLTWRLMAKWKRKRCTLKRIC